jgi:hypothetical protein
MADFSSDVTVYAIIRDILSHRRASSTGIQQPLKYVDQHPYTFFILPVGCVLQQGVFTVNVKIGSHPSWAVYKLPYGIIVW